MELVSIIIVNYNSGVLLERCIRSVCANVDVPCEVIVVDNSSDDDSLEFLKALPRPAHLSVNLIEAGGNLGFARANNLGAKHANGRILHFLNPDTRVCAPMPEAYRSIMARELYDAIYITPLVDENGRPAAAKFVLPLIHNYARALMGRTDIGYWYLGASLVMPRRLFERLGGWPADYFMYAEDLDLFFQAARLNIPVITTDAPVIHTAGGTTSRAWTELEREIRREASIAKFYRKHDMLSQYVVVTLVQLMRQLLTEPSGFWRRLKILWSLGKRTWHCDTVLERS